MGDSGSHVAMAEQKVAGVIEEVEQRIVVMSLAEFKDYAIPDGWRLLFVSGYTQYSTKASGEFVMLVTLEKNV